MRGYWVDEEVPEKLQHYTNIFMLHTPARSNGGFPLLAEDASSKMAWIRALQDTVRNNKRSPTHAEAVRTAEDKTGAQFSEHRHSYEEEDMITPKVTTVF